MARREAAATSALAAASQAALTGAAREGSVRAVVMELQSECSQLRAAQHSHSTQAHNAVSAAREAQQEAEHEVEVLRQQKHNLEASIQSTREGYEADVAELERQQETTTARDANWTSFAMQEAAHAQVLQCTCCLPTTLLCVSPL